MFYLEKNEIHCKLYFFITGILTRYVMIKNLLPLHSDCMNICSLPLFVILSQYRSLGPNHLNMDLLAAWPSTLPQYNLVLRK